MPLWCNHPNRSAKILFTSLPSREANENKNKILKGSGMRIGVGKHSKVVDLQYLIVMFENNVDQ